MRARLACIVEGPGDEKAVPILIRRIAVEINPALFVDVPRPVIVKRSRLDPRFQDFEAKIEQAVRLLQGKGGLLVLLDCDTGDPDQLRTQLVQRVSRARSDVPSAVVLACSEYEAWFLAAAESLKGQRGLPSDMQAPGQPEAIQGAKEWISKHWPKTRTYNETIDQPAFTQLFNMEQARSHSPSFALCYAEITRLLTLVAEQIAGEDETDSPTPTS